MEFLTLLLPLLIQFLPLILNKPEAVQKQAFLRRVVFYQKLAGVETASVSERMAAAEIAEICACCAESDAAGRQAILAGVQQANADAMAQLSAMAAAKGA